MSNGYGRIWRGDSHVLAHRVAYEKTNGLIPQGYQIHHVCRTRLCINPEHLVALSNSDHHKVHFNEDKTIGFDNSLRTHCPQGHLLDGKTEKQRFCKQCHTKSTTEYRHRHEEYYREYKRQWRANRKQKGLPIL